MAFMGTLDALSGFMSIAGASSRSKAGNGARDEGETTMRILVIGATGGSGRAAIEHLLAAGHHVTAFVRRADANTSVPAGLGYVQGDAMRAEDIERAVKGHDAVIVTLGITENPLRVRFFGPARTPLDVRSRGTRNVIAAMKKHGVRKLVVQTTYGLGETRQRLGFVDRTFFN